ncbi:hypothetical protein BN1708_018714, partial [Verticillium longisporum]
RRPGTHHYSREWQATCRCHGRGPLRSELLRVVFRGGAAHLRRDHPGEQPELQDRHTQRAHWRLWLDRTMELSRRHDHPQGRPGAGGRLYRCREGAGRGTSYGPCSRRAGAQGWYPQGRCQHYHGIGTQHNRSRKDSDDPPHHQEGVLHRIHWRGQDPHEPELYHTEETLP